MTENEHFGLVFAKTVSLNSGTACYACRKQQILLRQCCGSYIFFYFDKILPQSGPGPNPDPSLKLQTKPNKSDTIVQTAEFREEASIFCTETNRNCPLLSIVYYKIIQIFIKTSHPDPEEKFFRSRIRIHSTAQGVDEYLFMSKVIKS